MVENYSWGYVDDKDESLKGSGGFGKFGLNSDVRVTKFEYNPNAGKDNALADAIDIEVTIGDSVQRRRIYDITRVYDNKGNEIGPNDPDYQTIFNKNMTQNQAVLIHFAHALGVTKEQLVTKFNALKPNNFVSWSQCVISCLPPNFSQIPVDIFLEYQWNISAGQSQTYLEIPKNMKGGNFVCPYVKPVGSWNEQKSWIDSNTGKQQSGLSYIDDSGNRHPFTRNDNYMNSNKAIQQKVDDAFNNSNALNDINTPGKVTW